MKRHPRILIALFILSTLISSCTSVNEEAIEELPSTTTRAFSFPSSDTEFFNAADSILAPIIEVLRQIDSRDKFIQSFLQEYGMPLWLHTYIIDGENDYTFLVPLYNGQWEREITSFWYFYVADDKMTFAPFRNDDPTIAENEQRFVFDLLSYHVFGRYNSKGLTFIENDKDSNTRAFIEVTRCWDVYTGYGDYLEYRYSNCISHTYWVDIAISVAENNDFGSGTGIPIGGGGGGNGSISAGNNMSATVPNADRIFKNDSLPLNNWLVIETLIDEVMDDCMGGNLYNAIRNSLGGDKLWIEIVEGAEASYNWNGNLLTIGAECLESDVLLHEMMHIYQRLTNFEASFQNALMNHEIETQYAQYLYTRFNPPLANGFVSKLGRNYNNKAMEYIQLILNSELPDDIVTDLIEFQIVPYIRKTEAYSSYPFNNELSMFESINILTNNCD